MKPINQFISFATLTTGIKMPIAHQRWTEQIEHLKRVGLVQNGKIYSEQDLDEVWKNRFAKYVSDRGYAYWSWKPYLINQLFEKMQYGDSLCYFDGGCVFPKDENQLQNIVIELQHKIESLEREEYDIALTSSTRNVPCAFIVRKEILDKYGLSTDVGFNYEFPHWQAGLLVIVKTPLTEKLMHDWIQFYFDNYETCIHFPFTEKTGQIKGFIHNGADQAVLQCLLYKGKYKIMNINLTVRSTIKRHKR